MLKKFFSSKSVALSILILWLIGGSAIFHNHPFFFDALSISDDNQIHYTQHKNISAKAIPCPACLWERTPTDTTLLNDFAVFYPEFPASFVGYTAPQVSLFSVSLPPRSPPLFS